MAKQRKDDANAFLPDPQGGAFHTTGSVDEEMAEEFMRDALTGEDASEDIRDQPLAEELGGPFVISTIGQELADDIDECNPIDAMKEPVPSPMRGRA
ncbi:MAG: hypothetical protein ABI321_00520 [Polyangia bacterium]